MTTLDTAKVRAEAKRLTIGMRNLSERRMYEDTIPALCSEVDALRAENERLRGEREELRAMVDDVTAERDRIRREATEHSNRRTAAGLRERNRADAAEVKIAAVREAAEQRDVVYPAKFAFTASENYVNGARAERAKVRAILDAPTVGRDETSGSDR